MSEDVSKDSERLHTLMDRFWIGVNPRLKNVLLQGQINMPQYNTLVVLRNSGEITMGDLAKRLRVTMGASTNLVDRLVEAGYVERKRSTEDRRVVKVRLTPEAAKMLDERAEGFRSYSAGILSQIGPEERTRFLDIYSRIVEIMEREP